MSNPTGNSQLYDADDQRNLKKSELEEKERYNEGKENSHLANDSKDERSIANKLAAAEKGEDSKPSIEKQRLDQDATLPARAHGNKPSRGAEIDQEIREEEEAYLARKGKN